MSLIRLGPDLRKDTHTTKAPSRGRARAQAGPNVLMLYHGAKEWGWVRLPAELTDEPMLATKGGSAARVRRVTQKQKRKWKGATPTSQSAGAGALTSLSTQQPPKWVQVTLSDTFFPTPHSFFQSKSDFSKHQGQP